MIQQSRESGKTIRPLFAEPATYKVAIDWRKVASSAVVQLQ